MHDHPDEPPQSIVTSCTVHQLMLALVTHLMLAKLQQLAKLYIFMQKTTLNVTMCEPDS